MNAVISGGTKGIGRAIANLLADKGFNLAICSRHQDDLDLIQKQLQSSHPKLEFIGFKADVSNKSEVAAFAEQVKSQWDQVHILVNNAGIFLPGEVHKEEDGVLESQIETNLYSAYYLTRALLPNILNHKEGHIFNMCSVASLKAYPNGGSYSISKFALLGFSKVLREELKMTGTKVTAIMPGATWSNSWAGVDLPEERLMQASDVAHALWAAFQLSPSAVIEEIVIRPQEGDL